MKPFEIEKENLTDYNFLAIMDYYLAILIKNFYKYERLDEVKNTMDLYNALGTFFEEYDFESFISEDLSYYDSFKICVFDDYIKEAFSISQKEKDVKNSILFDVCHSVLVGKISSNILEKLDFLKEAEKTYFDELIQSGDWNSILPDIKNTMCNAKCIITTNDFKKLDINIEDFTKNNLRDYFFNREYEGKLPIEYNDFILELSNYMDSKVKDNFNYNDYYMKNASDIANLYATLITRYNMTHIDVFDNKEEFSKNLSIYAIRNIFKNQTEYTEGDVLQEEDIEKLLNNIGLIEKEPTFEDCYKCADYKRIAINNLTFPVFENSGKVL